MKKALKILGFIVLGLVALVFIGGFVMIKRMDFKGKAHFELLGKEAPVLNQNGQKFRDLNKNGKLDVYEDVNADLEARVEDVLSQMTLEEKAGSMFVPMMPMTNDGDLAVKPDFSGGMFGVMLPMMLGTGTEIVIERKINNFNILFTPGAEVMAKFNNRVQKYAERTRLGIPLSIASDPRHGTANNPGAAIYTEDFSQWPSFLGLAATRDTTLVREFGDIARKEYLATGIRVALHPMADLATEPRWGRVNGTFGEDAYLSAQMTKAYILGFQGDSLGSHSVACMTKHFSGGGPQEDGEDAHFPYGQNQVYPGDNFDYHLIPFTEGAFKAQTAQIMPYYGIPVGQTNEDVAFAFNKAIITTLLRDSLGFDGVVCTDWGLITDSSFGEARAWGVQELSGINRVKKVIEAGCDQFGGENRTELVIELVNSGQIAEERIDESIRRILRDKFRLGLFDNPYVDAENVLDLVGKAEYREAGKDAQEKSTVLLKNENILPLAQGTKVFVHNAYDIEEFEKYGEVVSSPEEADVVIAHLTTPYEPRNGSFLERFFHQGRLYYTEEEFDEFLPMITDKPSIVIVNLERPALLKEVDQVTQGLIAEFGVSDEILAEILFGKRTAGGKLPFELPSSWEAVLEQKEDVPYDSKDPLYRFGAGIIHEQEVL